MDKTLAELEAALDVVLTNAPINERAGKKAQAALERRCAVHYRAAIKALRQI